MKIVVANSKGGPGKTTLVMALADLLKADIVEWDLQKSIETCAKFTGRHKPVSMEESKAKHVVHDTPPYNSETLGGLFVNADLILIPVRMSPTDLVACKTVIDTIRKAKATSKACIVFNAIRKPKTGVYKKVKGYFSSSYEDIRKADTELSNLVGFQEIMEKPIYGKARLELLNLLEELKINVN